ncbi:C-C motif chemokine 15-like isoform X1 [Cavia porcellus]|uniref:C-C motif chemokine n=1 Tax=Cavia porcellus TaxID=10141 RepID=A0A286XK13_CAVPO|nr:C-C motif chemokine 15-like [Cavia porcellus]XP_013007810.1 C-C motif chemokine 15-like [Cavia porcellus]
MICMAALSFLIIAAALGSQASIIHDSKIREHLKLDDDFRPVLHGFHQPADCCFSYTSRKIQCRLMEDYFRTSSGCPRPGVIFLTKKGQLVCADPSDRRVQDCIRNLTPTSLPEILDTLKLA